MLKINNVTKSFDRIQALKDVTLTINKGEFFGLLGPNGAGKTTLMNLIVGYLRADYGLITIDGEAINEENIDLRRKIGYVPQEIALYPDLTAQQNLKIFGQLYEISPKKLNSKIDEILELVQLSDRRKDKVKNFSGGMKRRLNLAAGLLHEPAILLCDEPTVGIDPQSRNAIFKMLQNLNKSGITVIYTTHYMEEAERLCSRLAIIDHGVIIAEGTLAELIELLGRKSAIKIYKSKNTNGEILFFESLGDITEFDYFYEILPHNNSATYSEIFRLLEEKKIPPDLIELSRASLEDVFFKLTGRSLRD